MRKFLPGFITMLNLISGCIAIHMVYNGKMQLAVGFIAIALIFDFADGLIARLLNSVSELGKQLDSLADIISFGLAPAIIMLHLLQLGERVWQYGLPEYYYLVAFIIPVFAALRLAKFNTDDSQKKYFKGLPTPAVTILIASYPLLISRNYFSPFFPFNDYLFHFFLNPAVLLITTFGVSALMVMPVKIFSLKFENLKWRNNYIRYVFIIISVLLLVIFYFIAIPIIILLYVLFSFFYKTEDDNCRG